MKKLLFIALFFCLTQLNAQCSLTIMGNTVICSGTTTTLTASGAINYTWMPSGVQTASIAITPTTTTVYTVTGTTGTCTATNTVVVTVNDNPVLSFNTTDACDQTPVCYDNTTANQGNFTLWAWNMGDGFIDNLGMPACHMYSNAGIYNVVLTATTTAGCIGTVTGSAIVHPNPIADGGVSQACLGNGTFFVDASTVTNPSGINDAITSWSWDFGDGSNNSTPAPTHTYATCGVYTVSLTATTNFNCTNTISGTDTVFCLPTLTVTSTNPFMLCVGDTATITASGANTYTWSTLQTSASITVSPIVNTTYTVTGSSNYGCISTDTITQNTAICEGINAFNNNINITLYPNPNSGNFVVETNQTEKQMLQIIDVAGKLILQQTINGKANIEASSLDNGIYFVQINTGDGFYTKKIIVQH